MKPRIIYIHGNQTTHWSFGWSPWLKVELEKLGFETLFETMPDSIIARSEYWLSYLKEYAHAGENDVLLGCSSGAVAAMRYAEENQILGCILISPCYTDLGDDLERQSGYYDRPWLWDKIRSNQQQLALFYGDNDPYIPQQQFEFIAQQLQPAVTKIHNAGHFIEYNEFPQLLDYIKQTYAS